MYFDIHDEQVKENDEVAFSTNVIHSAVKHTTKCGISLERCFVIVHAMPPYPKCKKCFKIKVE